MELYNFVSDWFFTVPIETVWEEIIDVDSYPAWWPEFKKVSLVIPGARLQPGACIQAEAAGGLPYTLRFSKECTSLQIPYYIQFQVEGDLQGDLRYVLRPHAGGTILNFYWDCGTTKPIMNISARIPFVKGFLERNHNDMMSSGYRGLKARIERAQLQPVAKPYLGVMERSPHVS